MKGIMKNKLNKKTRKFYFLYRGPPHLPWFTTWMVLRICWMDQPQVLVRNVICLQISFFYSFRLASLLHDAHRSHSCTVQIIIIPLQNLHRWLWLVASNCVNSTQFYLPWLFSHPSFFFSSLSKAYGFKNIADPEIFCEILQILTIYIFWLQDMVLSLLPVCHQSEKNCFSFCLKILNLFLLMC